ncbi:nucleotide-binding domain containing protein, partial [Streptomyces sp. wa22]|uniref:nucleotide-binding domain containing protein n=1 Tax=Streptomyces sp. wa22 TaxID=1828244 RepID=UPI003966C09B
MTTAPEVSPPATRTRRAPAATRAQVAHARTRLPNRKLDIAALRADFTGEVAALVDFVRRSWEEEPGTPPLIHSVDDLGDLEQAAPDDGPAASELVERALAACATALVAAGARRVLVAGGETSGAVVTALGVRTLSIGAPIAPGVTWARADGRAHGQEHTVDLAREVGAQGGDVELAVRQAGARVGDLGPGRRRGAAGEDDAGVARAGRGRGTGGFGVRAGEPQGEARRAGDEGEVGGGRADGHQVLVAHGVHDDQRVGEL